MLALVLAVALTQAPPAVATADGSGPTHFASTFTGALLGAAPGAAVVAVGIQQSGTAWSPVAIGVGLALLPVGIALGATMGHALSGGRGNLGTAFIASAISVGVSAGALALFTFAGDASDRRKPQAWIPAASVALLLPIATVSIALELEHHRALSIQATPLRGGGAVSISGAL